MSIFQPLSCLIAYIPIEPAFFESAVREENEVQRTSMIPGWDDWLNDNSIQASIVNDTTGRVRGRAWGVSNPFENFRSVVGAQFRFQFILDPSRVAFPGERYRFSADIESDGRFLHTPAVPSSGDDRRPPATTISELDLRLDVLRILRDGNSIPLGQTFKNQDLFHEVEASQFLEETINTSVKVSQDFFPNGQDVIVFRITRGVIAAATGVFSDIRIRGSEGRFKFRIRPRNVRVRRVLEQSDPCFAILNP